MKRTMRAEIPEATMPIIVPTTPELVTRMPYRPESFAEEVERYPKRLEHYKARAAVATEANSEQAAVHRRTCTLKRCPDAAHVRPRRQLKDETPRDRRHLGACRLEDPECLDVAHLLPPHPLDVTKEYCCTDQHFLLSDPRALTKCPMVQVWLRERRQAEEEAFRKRPGASTSRVTTISRNYLTGTTDTSV